MPIEDGMPDLGNLPARTKAIRNKITGVVQTPAGLGFGALSDPNQENPWDVQVRFAYNHQDQLELLTYVPGEKVNHTLVGADDKGAPSVPTLDDGTPMTAHSLDKCHWQTLRKLAKQYHVPADAKTKLQIIDGILKAAYQDAGLEPPMPTPPKE